MNINTREAVKSIANLEQELKDTTEQLKQVEVGSDAFNELQKRAAECKGQIDQFNRATDTLSKGFQGFGENAAKMTSGITGGIAAATAAMQMMGIENENVTEGIAKLQQLMAFSQGVSSLKDLSEGFKNMKAAVSVATGSLKGLRGAIVATGIGALVVALGMLISNWDKVTAAIDDFIGKAGEASKVTAALDAFMAGLKQSVVAVGNAIVKSITTPVKSIIAAIKAYNEEEGSFFDKIKAAAVAGKDSVVAAGQSTIDGFKEVGTKATAAFYDSIDEQNAAKKSQVVAAGKQVAIDYAEGYKQGLELLNKYQEEMNAARKSRHDLQDPGAPTVEAEEEDPWLAQISKAQDYYNSLMSMNDSYSTEFAKQQQAQYDTLQYYLEEGLISQRQYTNAVKELRKQEASFQVSMSMSAASGVADILNSLADTMDESNEKQFKAQKAMQISAATIQMMVGITTALSGAFTTKTGPWDIALAAIQATSIAASGAAQIANIAKQQYNSSSSGTSSAALSSAATASTIVAPTQYSQAVSSANIESSIADARVYVVESDIQQTGTRVKTQERENRY